MARKSAKTSAKCQDLITDRPKIFSQHFGRAEKPTHAFLRVSALLFAVRSAVTVQVGSSTSPKPYQRQCSTVRNMGLKLVAKKTSFWLLDDNNGV
jgi:hypothetical protein